MPLSFKDAPLAAIQQLAKAFELLSNRERRLRGDGQPSPDQPQPEFKPVFPHAVYVFGLDQVVNRNSVAESASHVSWQYLIPLSSSVSTAEISISGDKPQFAELNYGPYAQNTLREIQALQASPDLARQDYEVRLLRIPALNLSALWLCGSAGEQMFIPIAPTSSALHAGQRYSEQELLDAIYSEAEVVKRAALELMEPSEALRQLTTSELIKLHKYARFLMKPLLMHGKAKGRSADDLMQEALTATLESRRMWNRNISFYQHLVGAIRSIASSWTREVGEEDHPSSQTSSDEVEMPEETWWPPVHITPERTLTAKQILERLRKLFPEGSLAQQVFDLRGEGYSSKEIQDELDISPLKASALSRQVRRALREISLDF
jgi:RNA polymerase sigma factor (sigma-70 family)